MNMNKFYNRHNLSRNHFAELAHVGVRSVRNYERRIPLRRATTVRIEKTINIIRKYDLRWPMYSGDRYMFLYEKDRQDMIFEKLKQREN